MIDSLIKSIMEQIGLLAERRAPQELLKTLPNGQWELLKKSAPQGLAPTASNPHEASNAMVSRLFDHASTLHSALQPHIDKHVEQFRQAPMKPNEWNQGKSKSTSFDHFHAHPVDVPVHPDLHVWGDQVEENTGQRPDFNTLDGVRGALKQYLLDLPRGQIDLGHLNTLREGSRPVPTHMHDYERHPDDPPNLVTEVTGQQRLLSTGDMEEIINHHVGDAESLKEIYDNNGGIGAIEALGRTLGTNASPPAYSGLKLNKQVHADLMDLMRPGWHKGRHTSPEVVEHANAWTTAIQDAKMEHPGLSWEEYRRIADERVPPVSGSKYDTLPSSTYESTPRRDDAATRAQEKAVADTSNFNYDDPVGRKAHENAAIDRALSHFKWHHKIK